MPKLCVWQTNHEISQTVCKSLAKGFQADLRNTKDLSRDVISQYDAHIAYGILRGTTEVFRTCDALKKPWFYADNGYTESGHFSGKYRISCRGTQARYISEPPRTESISNEHLLRPIQDGYHTLIIPPTKPVCDFFGIDPVKWLFEATKHKPYKIKWKDGTEPDFSQVHHVYTFNSSIGWKALLQGIRVTSDPLHSVVGSFLHTKCIDILKEPAIDINPLVDCMNEHQFTLREIEAGAAWGLIRRYLGFT